MLYTVTDIIKEMLDFARYIYFERFERCLYDQIYEYVDNILSKAQFGFKKGFSTQYSLITMTNKL